MSCKHSLRSLKYRLIFRDINITWRLIQVKCYQVNFIFARQEADGLTYSHSTSVLMPQHRQRKPFSDRMKHEEECRLMLNEHILEVKAPKADQFKCLAGDPPPILAPSDFTDRI